VFDHQSSEAGTFDEDDLFGGLDACDGFPRGFCEVAGCEEHAFLHTFDVERTDEVAHCCFAYRVLPALGLQVNGVQAERVFVDDAVNAVVCAGFG
jgi:hypothetical protein